MDEDQKYKMVWAMQRYGGSFIQALGECFNRADAINTVKLCNAFPEYVATYTQVAEANKHENPNLVSSDEGTDQ